MTIEGSGLRDLEWSKFKLLDDGTVAVQTYISSGISLTIGSVSATVDSIYIQSGTSYLSSGNVTETNPAGIGSFTAMALGSVAITNIGSVIQSTSPWVVSGTVGVHNVVGVTPSGTFDVDISAGSIQPYNQLGSVEIFQTTAADMVVTVDSPETIGSLAVQTVDGTVSANILGSIMIGSVTANVDAIYVQSGANMTGSSWVYQKTDPWAVSGIVTVSDIATAGSLALQDVSVDTPEAVGSLAVQTVDGTVTVTGIATAGSLALQDVDVNSPEAVGSLAIQTVDGTVSVTDIATAGSLAVQDVAQDTDPWVISGNVLATLGSQASIYTILCGVSGGVAIPLLCSDTGVLIVSGVNL